MEGSGIVSARTTQSTKSRVAMKCNTVSHATESNQDCTRRFSHSDYAQLDSPV